MSPSELHNVPNQSVSTPRSPHYVVTIILTYDAPEGLLEAAVESALVALGPQGERFCVVVVDNGGRAAARLAATIASEPERLVLIESQHNGGYGAGMNIGIEWAKGHGATAIALLNDDVSVAPTWLLPLLAELDAAADVGAVQPTLLQFGEEGVVNSAGVEIDRAGQGSDRGRGLPAEQLAGVSDIEAFTGGAVLIRREFFDAVGLFDERFFLYYEDVEIARRGAAARPQWRYRHVAASTVTHHGSASTVALGDDARRLQERNRIWCSVMHGSAREIASGLWLSIRRCRHQPRWAHIRALLQGLVGAPRRAVARAGGRQRLKLATVGSLRRIAGNTNQKLASRMVNSRTVNKRTLEGVNIVGYHHVSSGLGAIARQLVRSFEAAGVPCVAIDNDLTTSPKTRAAHSAPEHVYDTTIAVVTAFEFPYFCHRFPQLRGPGKRMIGSWLWELEEVPQQHLEALPFVDEVWAPTRFVQDAYTAVAEDTPVHFAPFRMEEPVVEPSNVRRWRERFDDAFTYLISFDYLSIVERKNPQAAIRAFREAFGSEPDRQVSLVVKTINGDQRPGDLAAIQTLAEGDDRIIMLDEHLADSDHHALLAAADCLVSLHRSEGYGLQPALAMWLRTPVIASRYSGVVDFMDDDCAAMVDVELVPVKDGQGIYPETAVWADPDSAEAAQLMRRMIDDNAWRNVLIENAHTRIATQPSFADFGSAYEHILSTPSVEPEPFYSGLDGARSARQGPGRRMWRRTRGEEIDPGSEWPDSARR